MQIAPLSMTNYKRTRLKYSNSTNSIKDRNELKEEQFGTFESSGNTSKVNFQRGKVFLFRYDPGHCRAKMWHLPEKDYGDADEVLKKILLEGWRYHISKTFEYTYGGKEWNPIPALKECFREASSFCFGYTHVLNTLIESFNNLKQYDGGSGILDYFLEYFPKEAQKLMNKEDKRFGYKPIHKLGFYGLYKYVPTFVKYGADINAQTATGNTIGHIALQNDESDERIKTLVKNGVNPLIKNKMEQNLVDLAKQKERSPELIQFLEENCVDVDGENNNLSLPLSYSFKEENGNVNCSSQSNVAQDEPLSEEKAREIFNKKFYSSDSNTQMAIRYLCQREISAVEALVKEKGIDINIADATNKNIGHCAAWLHSTNSPHVNKLDEFYRFFENGLDPNAKDICGNNYLHIQCADHDEPEIVYLLAYKGTDINAKNRNGKTPIEIAKQKGHYHTVGMLRKFGAKEDNPIHVKKLDITQSQFSENVKHYYFKHGYEGYGCDKDRWYNGPAVDIRRALNIVEQDPNLLSGNALSLMEELGVVEVVKQNT